MVPMRRLLYLPNEQALGDQVGPHAALERLVAAGTLEAVQAFSWQVLARERGFRAMADALVATTAAFKPDWALLQHVGAHPFTPALLQRLRDAAPGLRVLYHEGDLYGRGKPLPRPTADMLRAADVSGLVTRGAFAERVRRLTGKPVLFVPSAVDSRRFDAPDEAGPDGSTDFDVALIGNRVRSRLPWRRMPGAAARGELVRRLGRRFGARFGLFGHGWDGFAGWQGPLPYAQQRAALQRATVAAAWNHFDQETGYFSDRLPIGLLSGVPQVMNRQPGVAEWFGDDPPLLFGDSVPEVVAQVERLIAGPPAERRSLAERARAVARQRLLAEAVFPELLQAAAQAAGS